MHSPGINGEGELRGQPANPGSPGKWPLKRSVCVWVCVNTYPIDEKIVYSIRKRRSVVVHQLYVTHCKRLLTAIFRWVHSTPTDMSFSQCSDTLGLVTGRASILQIISTSNDKRFFFGRALASGIMLNDLRNKRPVTQKQKVVVVVVVIVVVVVAVAVYNLKFEWQSNRHILQELVLTDSITTERCLRTPGHLVVTNCYGQIEIPCCPRYKSKSKSVRKTTKSPPSLLVLQ